MPVHGQKRRPLRDPRPSKEALGRSANKTKAKRVQPLEAVAAAEEPPKKKIRSSGSRKRGLSGGERRGKKAKK